MTLNTTGRRVRQLLFFLGWIACCAAGISRAEDVANLEVHEWSVWFGEPQGKQVNSLADYISAMPGVVETERSRRRDSDKPVPAPLSVMTLYGDPPEVVDIDLRISAGRPLAQWPRSEGKSNRLRWLDLKVTKELTNPEALAYIPEGHWFQQARDLGGLYLQLKRGTRIERFLAYDLEVQTTLPVRVDGGPEQYKIANLGKHALQDLMLIVPGPDGCRIGWLDTIDGGSGATPNATAENSAPPAQPAAAAPAAVVRAGNVAVVAPVVAAAKPAPAAGGQPGAPAQPAASAGQPAQNETITEISLSAPLKLDSDEFREKTSGELKRRLQAAGLSEGEIELLHALYAKHFFENDQIQLLYRMSSAAIDEITPLSVEPETAKVKRVTLMVACSVDPRLRDDVQKLIADLGDLSYAKREQAEKRLTELGRLAIPSLKEALKSKDLEVVLRAERLLLAQKEQLGAE